MGAAENHVKRARFGSPDGAFDQQCTHCGAQCFTEECELENGRHVFPRCCRLGKLPTIPILPPAPAALSVLLAFTSVLPLVQTRVVQHFRRNVLR